MDNDLERLVGKSKPPERKAPDRFAWLDEPGNRNMAIILAVAIALIFLSATGTLDRLGQMLRF